MDKSGTVSLTLTGLRIYHVAMILIYIGVGVFLAFLFAASPSTTSSMYARSSSGSSALAYLFLTALCLVPFIILEVIGLITVGKQTKGAWIFQIILVALGFTSLLTTIPCVFLLIGLVSKDVKAFYKAG